MDIGPTMIQWDLVISWLYLQRPYFLITSYSEVLGGVNLEGHYPTQHTVLPGRLSPPVVRTPSAAKCRGRKDSVCLPWLRHKTIFDAKYHTGPFCKYLSRAYSVPAILLGYVEGPTAHQRRSASVDFTISPNRLHLTSKS